MQPLKKGDVVKLNSGGPKMSVTEVTEQQAEVTGQQQVSCVWINEQGYSTRDTFPAVCLVYVDGATDPDKPPPNPPH